MWPSSSSLASVSISLSSVLAAWQEDTRWRSLLEDTAAVIFLESSKGSWTTKRCCCRNKDSLLTVSKANRLTAFL